MRTIFQFAMIGILCFAGNAFAQNVIDFSVDVRDLSKDGEVVHKK